MDSFSWRPRQIRRVRGLLAIVVVPAILAAVVAVPTAAAGPTVKAVGAGGAHSCVRTSDGAVWCWGRNNTGQLGDGTETTRSSAVRVVSARGIALSGVSTISVGYQHNCARTSTGTAWCWGSNGFGQLGNGATTDRAQAVRVTKAGGAALTGVVAVSAGGAHSCARTSDGAAWCWGRNTYGQLGDGTTTDRLGAVRVTKSGGSALTGVTAVSAGKGFHSCARTSDGAAWCWGYNGYGQVGDGTTTDRLRAVRVTKSDGSVLSTVAGVSAGGYHSCARTRSGAWCWGSNGAGRLGDGTMTSRLRAVRVTDPRGDALTEATSVSAGLNHSCARTREGTARCWGPNGYGQLGNGTTTDRPWAVRVQESSGATLTGVTAVSAGDFHGCARTTAGAAWCWGSNDSGKLGDGTTTDRHRAVRVVAAWASAP